MSAVSFGTNGDDSNYLESNTNSPATENSTPDLLALIEETGNIHNVFREDLEDLNTPRVLFK